MAIFIWKQGSKNTYDERKKNFDIEESADYGNKEGREHALWKIEEEKCGGEDLSYDLWNIKQTRLSD